MTLKQRRVLAGLRQEDVAKKLEISQTAVSKWENGENFPLKKYQKKLARLYKCKIEELFSDADLEGRE